MDNLPKWVPQIQAAWAAIGALLITFGAGLPDWLPEIFSPEVTTILFVTLGSVIEFYQLIRIIVAAKPPKEGEVKIFSVQNKIAYLNPFKLAA